MLSDHQRSAAQTVESRFARAETRLATKQPAQMLSLLKHVPLRTLELSLVEVLSAKSEQASYGKAKRVATNLGRYLSTSLYKRLFTSCLESMKWDAFKNAVDDLVSDVQSATQTPYEEEAGANAHIEESHRQQNGQALLLDFSRIFIEPSQQSSFRRFIRKHIEDRNSYFESQPNMASERDAFLAEKYPYIKRWMREHIAETEEIPFEESCSNYYEERSAPPEISTFKLEHFFNPDIPLQSYLSGAESTNNKPTATPTTHKEKTATRPHGRRRQRSFQIA